MEARFALAFVVALAVSLGLIPLARRLSFRLGAVSVPGGRNVNKEPMPRLGGLAIFVACLFGGAIAAFLFAPRH
mgnify:CR=1 FL=1